MPDYEKMFWTMYQSSMYAIWQIQAGFYKMAEGTLERARETCREIAGYQDEFAKTE